MPIAALWPIVGPAQLPTIRTGARSEADYLAAIQALLPRGRAWPRDPAALMTALLDGFAKSYATTDARQTNLLTDAFPVTTVELLPEWESTLGLPDPCLGEAPTLQQRQGQVVARFKAQGGQSVAYLNSVAEALGFRVAITEFANFRSGINHAGDGINGSEVPTPGAYFIAGSGHAGDPIVMWLNGSEGFDWSFAIMIKAISEPTEFFRAGVSSAGEPIESSAGDAALAQLNHFTAGSNRSGDPIESWGSPLLECELRRIAPAHSTLIFAYGS